MKFQEIEASFRAIRARKETLSGTFEVLDKEKYKKISRNNLWLKFLKNGASISWENFNIFLEASDLVPHYNIAKEWLESLPKTTTLKDPFSRLSNLIVLLSPQTRNLDMLKLALKNWFVGAVKAIYEPDYIPKYTLVLVGEARMGKTSFLRSFVPQPLKNLVIENPCCVKKSVLAIKIFGLIEELGNWIKKNSNDYRGFLTGANEGKRLTSFLASCKQAEFLKEHWSERFVVFWLERIWNRKEAEEVGGRPIVAEDFPMEELWIQALKLHKEGYEPDFSFDDISYMQNQAKIQFKKKKKEDVFWNYFEPTNLMHTDSEFWTPKQICDYLSRRRKLTKFSPTHMGRYLLGEGLKHARKNNKRGFWLIEKLPEKEKKK